VARLETQLADARPWLLGSGFSLADAASYHPLWFLRVAPGAQALLAEFPHVGTWMAAVEAMGQGDRLNVSAADALAAARDAEPATPTGVDPREPSRLATGTGVTVATDAYAFDPVAGPLVESPAEEIAIRRSDPAVGTIVVHFPRFGFRVARTR